MNSEVSGREWQIYSREGNASHSSPQIKLKKTDSQQTIILTRDQSLLLFTLYLNGQNGFLEIPLDDCVCIGDMNVARTVKDLLKENFLHKNSNRVEINQSRHTEIKEIFKITCLQSYIDREFLIQVASVECLNDFSEACTANSELEDESEDSKTGTPYITIMRLIIEIEPEEALSILRKYDIEVEDVLPPFLFRGEYDGWIEKLRDW
ncbi:uncharacterized protein LOC134252616 [Saccostrea cucullata]|uniref:uncharacterized protein LOC134252616 n=1 Tax=Saccostrea cuccullata TaxID=36930 RepID=UPI002ED51661